MSHTNLSHTEPECQENLIRGKIHIKKKIKQKPLIFIKLSFRQLPDSKLSGLHAFDNMAIIH